MCLVNDRQMKDAWTARIEVMPADFERLMENRQAIIQRFEALGFIYVAMDLKGFKSGSLNAVLQS